MSTVVLTPTHIAGDHTVIKRTYPHHTKVDIDHRKVFIAPNNVFVVGTVGDYLPEQIDTPETWSALSDILSNVLTQLAVGGLVENKALIPNNENSKHYDKVFDKDGYTFIATKHQRFLIKYDRIFEKLMATEVGKFAGIGSGGVIATGLLRGGMPLREIWEPLHHLDHLTSTEHTSFPLSLLKNTRQLTKTLRKIREDKSDALSIR